MHAHCNNVRHRNGQARSSYNPYRRARTLSKQRQEQLGFSLFLILNISLIAVQISRDGVRVNWSAGGEM